MQKWMFCTLYIQLCTSVVYERLLKSYTLKHVDNFETKNITYDVLNIVQICVQCCTTIDHENKNLQ